MAVSVDPIKTYLRVKSGAQRFGSEWCHLMVDKDDPLEELHHFAQSIGVKREWFQDHPTVPHYDLTPSMRRKAVSQGAIELEGIEQAHRCYRGERSWQKKEDGLKKSGG